MARKALNNPRQIRSKSCGCRPCVEKYRPDQKATRKDCTGPWQARWRDPGGKQVAKNFPTMREAEDHLVEVRSAKNHGTYLDPARSRVTLEQWHAKWWPNQRAARNTLNRDERMWRLHVKPAFGAWPLTDITWLDVDRWVKQLLGPLDAASIPAAFQILDRLMTAAVLDKRLLNNPCDGIKLPRRRKKHPEDRKPPTLAQLDLIRAKLPEHHHPLMLVAQETGLRWSELVGLRRCCVDLDRGRVHVREVLEDSKGLLARKVYPKSDAGLRTVPLTPLAIEAIEQHLKEHPADASRSEARDGLRVEELVFRGSRDAAMRQGNFYTTWLKAIRGSGVARKTENPTTGRAEWWPRWHSIRHAYASRLHSLGVPEVVVQEILGHERGGDITWLYTHAAADVAGQVLAALTQERPPLRVVSTSESTSSPQPAQPPATLGNPRQPMVAR